MQVKFVAQGKSNLGIEPGTFLIMRLMLKPPKLCSLITCATHTDTHTKPGSVPTITEASLITEGNTDLQSSIIPLSRYLLGQHHKS